MFSYVVAWIILIGISLQFAPGGADEERDRRLRDQRAFRHASGRGRSLAHVVQIRQVDKGQDAVVPAAGLPRAVPAIGFTGQ